MDTWFCDSCGGVIDDVEDGWVEWITVLGSEPGQRTLRDLRLVHHNSQGPSRPGCQFNGQAEFARDGGTISDLPLKYLVGPDGLMRLLEMLEDGELPADEVLEMIKRLHVPGYEQARPYFDEAIADGVFEPDGPEGFYRQSQIEATIRFARSRGA